MADPSNWGLCARCHKRIDPFGAMKHVFVDADFNPICVQCARDLVPEVVARAEADDKLWEETAGDEGDKH